jgi:hypothetical protein
VLHIPQQVVQQLGRGRGGGAGLAHDRLIVQAVRLPGMGGLASRGKQSDDAASAAALK